MQTRKATVLTLPAALSAACVACGPVRARPCLQTADVSGLNSHFSAMRRGDLTDQQWQQLEPLLPPEKPRTGRPNEDHRQILNGILWIHRTGAPWRDLPRRYGPVGTVSSRFYRWRKAGLWQRILSDLQAEAQQRGEIDWDLHFVDATIVRAHQHAGGARRDGATPEAVPAREALGRSQGGFSSKLHLRAEGNGRPITVVLTGGERNEQIALEAVLDQGAVRRPGRGRPRLRPRAAACDKGYSSPTARARLRRRHIRPVIPTRKDQPRQRNFDREAYRLRNKVARLINRLKQARRVATRYEKRGNNYLAIVHICMILLWLKPFADTAQPRGLVLGSAIGFPSLSTAFIVSLIVWICSSLPLASPPRFRTQNLIPPSAFFSPVVATCSSISIVSIANRTSCPLPAFCAISRLALRPARTSASSI